jgi:broad specificity phosphatase PhoE
MVIRMRKFTLLVLLLLVVPRAAVAPHASAFAQATADKQTGSLRLYIARHGETDWNVQHKLQGMTDIPLNENGRRQAAALAESLKGVHLDAIYSSTLSRSRDTARTVAGTSMTVKSLDGLRERNYGHFQGGSDAEPDFVKRMNAWDDRLDDGESLNQLLARARDSLAQIRREHPAGNVLIVAHRITNQMILRALLDLTPEQTVKITQDNDEVYLVEFDPGAKPRLWKLIREKNMGDL